MAFVACYDLEQQLVSSDFYGWLIEWANKGATEIVFKTDKYREGSIYSNHIMRRRFETMLKPGPAFIGLPSREGDDGERVGIGSKNKDIIKFARENRSLRKLRSVLAPKDVRYTITIRQALKSKWRNSNRDAWLKFASEIGAFIIEDYEVKPFDIYDLMALYAGAKMNFGVWGGPMYICSLSEYPCMIFNCQALGQFLEKSGAVPGEHMPWCRDNQFTFWEPDNFAYIDTRFKEWRCSI